MKQSIHFYSDKNMGLFELKKLTVARQKGFTFNQINKLTKKFFSHRRYINISYNLKFQTPILRRHFFKTLSQNHDYIQTRCNDRNVPFHFACRRWYLYNIPQS